MRPRNRSRRPSSPPPGPRPRRPPRRRLSRRQHPPPPHRALRQPRVPAPRRRTATPAVRAARRTPGTWRRSSSAADRDGNLTPPIPRAGVMHAAGSADRDKTLTDVGLHGAVDAKRQTLRRSATPGLLAAAQISLAGYYNRLGKPDEARAELEQARRTHSTLTPYDRACMAAVEDRPDEAMRLLGEVVNGHAVSAGHLVTDPDLESVRGHPWLRGAGATGRAPDARRKDRCERNGCPMVQPIAPSARSATRSVGLRPARSVRTASVCSPRSGGRRTGGVGSAPSLMGLPDTRKVPASG